jgi:Mor family transcriptional regulator
MPYVNAIKVLPPELVRAIQQHVDGQLIYVPKKSDKRCEWGSKSGGRSLLQQRNLMICQAFQNGGSLEDLAKSQHLSEDSIRKIVAMNHR